MPKLSLFVLFSIVAFAQEQPLEFSMQQAIEYALVNNRSALDSQSDVRFAELQKWETTATGLPQINGNVKQYSLSIYSFVLFLNEFLVILL